MCPADGVIYPAGPGSLCAYPLRQSPVSPQLTARSRFGPRLPRACSKRLSSRQSPTVW